MASQDQISLFEFSSPNSKPSPPQGFNPDLIPTDATVPIPAGTYQTMEQMRVHCNQCFRCALGENRTNAVIGRGNVKAPIMVVGEGPGQNEDETGLPFVGKAGQLLDKILASVKLSENDVYICNVVKCRPPRNRDPQPAEIEACKGYLLEQIRMVNPKIILLTGKYAMLTLLGIKQGITKVRGEWVERDGRLYMPIFHPAYLLRNQSREKGSPKWLMWQDIQEVRKKLDEMQGSGE
ncbi:uracil-DNA glycosylase [Leptothermofonsia sp. ETS-13]|uniref:uracil-DNA glycosylase n=1 Tax=Leptothermofonsia sp. ETS-13 TaxID=3035696 RepID=UPI003B9EE134